MIHELKTVILTTDLPDHSLKAGDLGTVVSVHEHGGYKLNLRRLVVKPWQWFRCLLTRFVLWATGRWLTHD
jgi:hypothetical protein